MAHQVGGSGGGDYRGDRRASASALPAARQRFAPLPVPLAGTGPMPKRWFCSRDCKAFHDSAVAADAASRAEFAETSDVAGRGCQLCAAAGVGGDRDAERRANADEEDIWHLLFTCEHPAMLAIRGDMRLSAYSHCVALAESLLAAVERALEWYPGDAIAGAAVRVAVDDLRRVVQGLRDVGAGLDSHCLYRLMMALPFSANAIPPPAAMPPPMPPLPRPASTPPLRRGAAPPPPAAPLPVDHYAASRALGRVFDLVRLPNAVLRPAANRAVNWASTWICTIAAARRAVLFPAPVAAVAPPAGAPRSPTRPVRSLPASAANRLSSVSGRGAAVASRGPAAPRTDSKPCADSAVVAPPRQSASPADCVPPYAASGGVPLLDSPLPGAPGPPTGPSRAPA